MQENSLQMIFIYSIVLFLLLDFWNKIYSKEFIKNFLYL